MNKHFGYTFFLSNFYFFWLIVCLLLDDVWLILSSEGPVVWRKFRRIPALNPYGKGGSSKFLLHSQAKACHTTELLPFTSKVRDIMMSSCDLFSVFVCLRDFQCSSTSCIWFITKSWTCSWSQDIADSRRKQHYECQPQDISVNSRERFATSWTYFSYFSRELLAIH